MWMAQRGRASQREDKITAQIGAVTLSQLPVGVYVDGERRNLPLYTMGGYCWRPDVGDSVLVIKTSGGDCVAGCAQEEDDLAVGEVKISSNGGGAIYLTAEGGVQLSGDIMVNGEGLEEMVARIVLANTPTE